MDTVDTVLYLMDTVLQQFLAQSIADKQVVYPQRTGNTTASSSAIEEEKKKTS